MTGSQTDPAHLEQLRGEQQGTRQLVLRLQCVVLAGLVLLALALPAVTLSEDGEDGPRQQSRGLVTAALWLHGDGVPMVLEPDEVEPDDEDGGYFSTTEVGTAAWCTTVLSLLLLAAAALATLIPARPLYDRWLRVLVQVVGVTLLVGSPLTWLVVGRALGDELSSRFGGSIDISPGVGLVAPALVAICLLVGSRTGAPDGLPEQVR